MVPRPLWDRVNAVDSAAFALTGTAGPALAGLLTAWRGAEAALVASAVGFSLSALVVVGLRDPSPRTPSRAALLHEAWSAFTYVIRHPSLRGLALTISVFNIGTGLLLVALPVLVLGRLHGSPAQVGELWAISGLATAASAFVFGRVNSEGRERPMVGVSILFAAAAYAGIAFSPTVLWAFAGMMLLGLATGLLDLTLFSLRQRRTDAAWFGRAFAVSASLNFSGIPLGSAVSGPLIGLSLSAALGAGAVVTGLASLVAVASIPGSTSSRPASGSTRHR